MASMQGPEPDQNRELVELRRFNAADLESILQEECRAWREGLDWDFERSAALVRRFADMKALTGAALLEQGKIAGYMYFVIEEEKGLVGDIYVQRELRTVERENVLLASALRSIMAYPGVKRIESQVLMLAFDEARPVPRADCLTAFERNFMRIDLAGASLRKGKVRRPMYVEKWSDHYHDAASQLIAAAYLGHIDSRINDQYRTAEGARRFLHNIIQYPGCGAFNQDASVVAFEGVTGKLCGISLASLVTPTTGHVTQICVGPGVRGTGIGHELLRQSLTTLKELGCTAATLTVTAANEDAVDLYERVGFETIRRFPAFVWEGF
jgi:ribosomal protein S18 acetylase RimI-like enzyme